MSTITLFAAVSLSLHALMGVVPGVALAILARGSRTDMQKWILSLGAMVAITTLAGASGYISKAVNLDSVVRGSGLVVMVVSFIVSLIVTKRLYK